VCHNVVQKKFLVEFSGSVSGTGLAQTKIIEMRMFSTSLVYPHDPYLDAIRVYAFHNGKIFKSR